jgi:hypothetical protein|tara:strand:- start:13698 stop:13895 length:198 start_codon:yes stop_codon:yes gene_type:complete
LTREFFAGQRSDGRGYRKLSAEDVADIKHHVRNGTKSRDELIRIYSISKSTYYDIVNGNTWKDLK